MKVIATFILAFCLFIESILGQNSNYRFKQLDIHQGLSTNSVNVVFKDSHGFVWIGTNMGLNRYDGYKIKVFLPVDNDSNSISSTIIKCIVEDKDSNLWIGTNDGLNKYNPETEQFTRFQYSSYKNSINGGYVYDLVVDNANNIWIASSYGINLYLQKEKLFKTFEKESFDDGMNQEYIYQIERNKEGSIFFLSRTGKFMIFNSLKNKFNVIARFKSTLPYLKQENIFVDNDGKVWVTFGNNTYNYNPKTGKIDNLQNGNSVFEAPVMAICNDKLGNLWLGTADQYLHIYNAQGTQLLYTYKQGEEQGGSELKGIGIFGLYCDNSGVVWISTLDGGVIYYHKDLYSFQTFKNIPNKATSLTDNRVNYIKQASSGIIYVGTEKGLDVFDYKSNTFTKVNSVKESPVLCIMEDKASNIWVSTYNGALYKGKGINFSPVSLHAGVYDNLSIRSMIQDSEGRFWFGSISKGIFNLKNNVFSDEYSDAKGKLSNGSIFNLYEDASQNIWVATSYGLNRIKRDKTIKIYDYVGNTRLLNLYSFFEDSKKRLWIGSHSGLLLYINEKDSFILFNKSNGLTNDQILGITEDNLGNLWLLSPNGLLRVNFPNNNLSKMIVQPFGEEDGLPSSVFRVNAISKLKTGELIVGTPSGLGVLNPSMFRNEAFKFKPIFSNLLIYNQSINVNEKVNKKIILKKAISELSVLELGYQENVFSIEFGSLNYINPQKLIYQYKLKGFNNKWIVTNSSMRLATYTNLDPGEYTLVVKSGYNEENWGPESSIKIIIHPPFWRSTLAKVLYILLTVLSLILLRLTIRYNERKRIRVNQEKEEAQRLHKLDMMKINLFTNVSHEFRTPLTLIISPLEKILSESKFKELDKPLKTMYRNSQRLLHLVNQLLDFRKLEAYGLEFSPSTGDIISFTMNIVQSFNDIAEGKGMRYIFNSNIKELVMQFDHDKYDKIIYNLLSNAFKYTHEKGTIAVELNFTEELSLFNKENDDNLLKNGELIIKVKDTGIGIPRNLQSTIFEQFVQVNSIGRAFEQGSGIGLSLVHEYVRMHKGMVQVESEEGKGSCFTVKIPVTKYENPILKSTTANDEIFEVYSELTSENTSESANNQLASILIVEDNEELRFYLKDNLKKKFKVFEADNGFTGFQQAQEIIPDIVISDVLMPVMDGIALCQKLKTDKATSHIPVIMLTAMNSDNYKLEGIEAGADDYIVKPFNFKILEARINRLIQNQKVMQQRFTGKINVEPKEIAITSLDEQFISKALELVEQNISNPDFSVEEFSREMAMSRMLLYKKLLALTGKAPLDFVRTMRLKRAAQYLTKSQLNISEIATQVGFSDSKYFSQCFKKEFNMLPSEYITKNAVKG